MYNFSKGHKKMTVCCDGHLFAVLSQKGVLQNIRFWVAIFLSMPFQLLHYIKYVTFKFKSNVSVVLNVE